MIGEQLATMDTARREYPLEKFHPAFQCAFRLEARAEEVLSYSTGRVPYWGLIRLATAFLLRDRALGESHTRNTYLERRRFPPPRILRYVFDSFRRTPFLHANRGVVFFCSGTNRLRRHGRVFNTRVDYFAEALAQYRPLLVEGAEVLRYSWPRAVDSVSFKGGLTVPAALWARIGRLRPGEDRRIQEFLSLVRSTCGEWLDSSELDFLASYLRRLIVRSRASYALHSKLLDRLEPQVVFVENAHCCLDLELITAARERNVTTVEYQHGAISPSCPHHNFHPRILEHGYARYLPDYFLSYGDFWNQFLTTSAEVVSIGNPYLTDRAMQLSTTEPVKRSVYMLSSANAPQHYIEPMLELLEEGYSVTFRPHPVERPLLRERYGTFFEDAKIDVDLGDDFYSLLPKHEYVVGDGRSTSLFEAFAIVGNRVHVLKTGGRMVDVLPDHDFLRSIESVRDLGRSARESGSGDVAVEHVFAPDWQERFARFMRRIL